MADTNIKSKKLAVLVRDDKYMDQLINLTKTAHLKGVETRIFFTGKGVMLTQDPGFESLVGKARLMVCDVSFRALGLSGDVPGVGFKDFVTQAKNAEMIEECDRYVVF